MINIFILNNDRLKTLTLHFTSVIFFCFVFFSIHYFVSSRLGIREKFLIEKKVKMVAWLDSNLDINDTYIDIKPNVNIRNYKFSDFCIFMQTRNKSSFFEQLSENEMIINVSLANKHNLKIGDSVYIEKKYKPNIFTKYIIKELVQDTYFPINSYYDFYNTIFISYDKLYDECIKTNNVLFLSKQFLEDLPQCITTHIKSDININEIKKFYFIFELSFLIIYTLCSLAFYIIVKNFLKEDLFLRIFNLFNLGQRKSTNVGLLFQYIAIVQFIPTEIAIFIVFIAQNNKSFYLGSLHTETLFNIFFSCSMFLIALKKDMKQGGTNLL